MCVCVEGRWRVLTCESKEVYTVLNAMEKKIIGNKPYCLLRKQITTNKISRGQV